VISEQDLYDLRDLIEELQERVDALTKKNDALIATLGDLEERLHIDHAAAELRAARFVATLGDLEERLRSVEPQPVLR
jgi:hypothetical protein